MASNANPTDSRLVEGDPIRPGFFRGSGTKRGHRMLVLGVVTAVLIVAVGIGLVVFSSMSRQPQSYKDGFSAGGAVYASDGSAEVGASQACKATEARGPDHGGLPSGANATEWLNGCVAAFVSAQSGN
jgi:hypothetical protein